MAARDLRLGLLLALVATQPVLSQEPDQPSDQQRAEHLARMKDLAGSIRLLDDPQQADSAVKLLPDPVLRYGDSTRRNYESTLWIWSSGGRPAAILAVEFYPTSPRGPRWLYEIASLSAKPIGAEHAKDFRWTGKGPGLAFARLDDAEPVADKAPRRLSQMKQLFRRFEARETEGTDGRIVLRPLPSPLHRYASADEGIHDGAIFAFCNGTNPEVLVVLEAQQKKSEDPAWHYALVQLTGGAVTVDLDGEKVWERREADPPAVRDNYVNGWFTAKE